MIWEVVTPTWGHSNSSFEHMARICTTILLRVWTIFVGNYSWIRKYWKTFCCHDLFPCLIAMSILILFLFSSLLSSLVCFIIFLNRVFEYVFLQFSKLYSLFLAPCTLFSCSPYIYESYSIHELGAHTYLLPPKLWYHRACLLMLSFMIRHDLVWLMPLSV